MNKANMTKPETAIEAKSGEAVGSGALVRRLGRRLNWWLDHHLWFRLGLWTRKYDNREHYNRPLAGLHAFAWAKFCGYSFRHAWRTGCIYWTPHHAA
jgi:hypothetical protein